MFWQGSMSPLNARSYRWGYMENTLVYYMWKVKNWKFEIFSLFNLIKLDFLKFVLDVIMWQDVFKLFVIRQYSQYS